MKVLRWLGVAVLCPLCAVWVALGCMLLGSLPLIGIADDIEWGPVGAGCAAWSLIVLFVSADVARRVTRALAGWLLGRQSQPVEK